MATRTAHRHRRRGMFLGACATALGAVFWLGGFFQPLDDLALDLHLQYAGTIEPHPDIVLIDIDDHALQHVEHWPWNRRRFAELIDLLDELAAKSILLDIVFSEPSRLRLEQDALAGLRDVDTGLTVLGDPRSAPLVDDDAELADAIRRAGNVYLAMFARHVPPASGNDPRPYQETEDSSEHGPAQAALMAELREDFTLDVPSLAQRTGRSAEEIERDLVQAKQAIALEQTRRYFANAANPDWREFYSQIVPGQSPDVVTPDWVALVEAFRQTRAIQLLLDRCSPADATLSGRISRAFKPTMPLPSLMSHAAGIGDVTFRPEKRGATIRSVPLLSEWESRVLLQLATRCALDVLNLDPSKVKAVENELIFGGNDDPNARRLPLDPQGATLVNWHIPKSAERWEKSFVHLPVARLMEVAANRRTIAENHKRLRLAMAELVEIRHQDTPGEYAEYVRLLNRHLESLRRRWPVDRASSQADDADITTGWQANALRRIAAIEEDALTWLERARGLWLRETPVGEEESGQRDRILSLYDRLVEGRLAERIQAANQRLHARNETLLNELSPYIRGRICLVGYTASAVADFVPTPVSPRTPGVMIHANVLNMLIQNAPIHPAPSALGLAMLLAAGAVMAAAAASRNAIASLTYAAFLSLILCGSGAVVFRYANVQLPSLAACAITAGAWVVVTVYRQLVEERERRRFQLALSQYSSPAVAAAIAEKLDASALRPVPARVSCFFADLTGFTAISERLGAENTRAILNPFLEALSRVLIEHNALVNKFIGDGVFAFFNAPIRPEPLHARAACRSALAAQEALRLLNEQGWPVEGVGPLHMRIGISTGESFVGDYGSDAKLDYTCIGDVANVGSRMEQLNKALGTRILVDEPTWREAADGLAFRYLGLFRLAGRQEPVEVFELAGQIQQNRSADHDFIAAFEQAVRLYRNGRLEAAKEGFLQYLTHHPDDAVAKLYLARMSQSGPAILGADPPDQPIILSS